MENENATDDVIVNEEEQVVEQTDDQTTGSVTTEGQEEVQQEVVETQPEERDDYYKNRSFELERKLSNLTSDLPKMIEETIIKTSETKQEKQEYTVAELEAYAMEHPEHRPWVEEQKEDLRDKRLEAKLQAKEEKSLKVQRRQQSEAKVLGDPRYADAFMKQPNGSKVLNPNSQLAHKINTYLNDSRLKGQPDSLEVAAKLAYADLVTQDTQVKDNKLTTLKRQNTKLKQATIVEGGGVNNNVPTKNNYDTAMDKLRTTGNRKDAHAAVKEYLARVKK